MACPRCVAIREKRITPHDPSNGSISIGIAHFLSKEPRPYTIVHRVDRTAKYMNESTFPKFFQT